MIKRSPAEYFIRYLLVHPDKYNNAAVREQVQELELYCPLDRQLDQLRRQLRPPQPFFPRNSHHQESMRFLHDAGVHSMFFPDRATRRAMDILRTPPVRQIVEQYIIKRADAYLIVDGLGRFHNFPCSEAAIRRYRHFFLNDSIVTRSEIVQALVITARAWATANDRDLTAIHLDAEKRASYRDPRIMAAETPNNAFSQLAAYMQMGYMPKTDQYDAGRLYEQLELQILASAGQTAARGGPNAARDLQNYLQSAKIIREILQEVVTPEQATLREFRNHMQLESDGTRVPNLKLLSGGSHTTDMQPLGKTDGDPVEVEDDAQDDTAEADA